MSFRDEIDAFRAARDEERATQAERDAAERQRFEELIEAARTRLQEEVEDLWHSTKEYWEENAARIAQPAVRHITEGDMPDREVVNAVMVPFPQRPTTLLPSARRDLVANDGKLAQARPYLIAGTHETSETIEAISINGWFALSAPGELRATWPGEGNPQYRYEIDRRLPEMDEGIIGYPEPLSYCILFRDERTRRGVAVRCTAEGPVEVWMKEESGWHRHGSLREHVIAVVSELRLDTWPKH
ncbi:hypothetical protein ACPPVQ_18835 [Diaminobutyricibacter sp. McL0618]|uniref:hypothetical protein n=1 Tax=Leifsonia sp. McL0618 TaxID=3415677 RepID=UPI003CED8874